MNVQEINNALGIIRAIAQSIDLDIKENLFEPEKLPAQMKDIDRQIDRLNTLLKAKTE